MRDGHVFQNWDYFHNVDKNEFSSIGIKFIKEIMKLTGFAFLIVILLLGYWVEEAKAQSIIEVTPKQLSISGIIGTSSFQHPFTLHAVNENITELTFSSSNLLEITGEKSWISGSNIQVTPEVKTLRKGQNQDFIVTVQNIPESGQYEGTIAISYKEQDVDAQETLLIIVQATKFSANPPQIILKFEKSISGIGGAVVPWTMALNEYSGLAPQEMITTLSKNTSISLDPLVDNEDKSLIIRPEQLLLDKPVISETRSYGQGLTLNVNFSNPQVPAGKYSGMLTVRSRDMGVLATVPVEVQVRNSSLLAWLLIVLGIFASLLVNWWNTTGKKKNAIRRDELEVRRKLDNAEITETCRNEIKETLNDVDKLLDDDKFVDAQNKITEAETARKKGVNDMKKLVEKVSEIKDIKDDLDNKVVKKLEDLVAADAPVIKTYMRKIKTDLEIIEKDIKQEKYLSVDDGILNLKVNDQKKKVDAFIFDAPKGLLDSLEELKEDLKRLDKSYQPALEHDIKNITENLGSIVREKDVEDVLGKINYAAQQIQKVDSLSGQLKVFLRQIEEGRVHGFNMDKANEELDKCKGYLADGNISMAENHIKDIEKAIEEASPPLPTPSAPLAVASSNYLTNAVLGIKDAGYTEMFKAEEKTPSAPKRSELNQKPSIERSEKSLLQKKSNFFISFSEWWTPERQELSISIALYIIAIAILAVIGFSQLYANNPIFGAKSFGEEYLALFLWGFGIQTGTATVAGVLKEFRGSQSIPNE